MKESRLGPWLKERMIERGISRNDLARLTGLAAGTISKITVYNYVPKPEAIFALADFFRIDRNSLLELAGVVNLGDVPDAFPDEVRDLVRRIYRLDPEDRGVVLDQVQRIVRLVEARPRYTGLRSPRGRGKKVRVRP